MNLRSHSNSRANTMNPSLLQYYEAIERASQDMLEAARVGNWDAVVKLEGACALLISQLKNVWSDSNLRGSQKRCVRSLTPWIETTGC